VTISFYGVVAGWTIDYTIKAASNAFVGQTPADLENMFNWIYKQNSKMAIKNKSQLDKFYIKFIHKNVHDMIKNSHEHEIFKDSKLQISYTLETVNRIIRNILKPTIIYHFHPKVFQN